jgi:hypothetical protein
MRRQGRSGLLGRARRSLDALCRPPLAALFRRALTEDLGGAKIYFKRDELNHTGAHKINNVPGQILLARRMGKTRIIAETGAGQHGVATATVCARFGLQCVVYMGATDVERQAPNVFRMKLLGAEVIPGHRRRGTLKDAMNEALRDWVANVDDTFYCIGTAPARTPIRRWCATSSRSSARKPARRCWSGRAPARRWSPASAAAPTPWACSIPSSTTRTCASSASKPAATASTTDGHAPR